MENNTYYQPQFNQIYAQPADMNYNELSNEFLTMAIVSCAISTLPIGSIIAIFMASKNRKKLLDYLGRGGLHTPKIKVSSALSRAGKYSGIAMTVIWAFYMLFFLAIFGFMILAIIANLRR